MFGKTSAFAGEFDHYYSKDPAFNTGEGSGFDHAKWIETGDDAYLPRHNGTASVRFTLRRITGREWLYVQDVSARDGESSGLWMLVALSLRGITPYQDADGNALQPRLVSEGKVRRLSDADMDRVLTVDDGMLLHELAFRVVKEMNHDPL